MNCVPHEEIEQAQVVEYLELRGFYFTAIPNSTYTKSWKQKTKNKQQGLRAGLPDLLIVIPRGPLLFLEMKRVKGGVVSEKQKQWINVLNNINNVHAEVAKGFEHALEIIKKYENY